MSKYVIVPGKPRRTSLDFPCNLIFLDCTLGAHVTDRCKIVQSCIQNQPLSSHLLGLHAGCKIVQSCLQPWWRRTSFGFPCLVLFGWMCSVHIVHVCHPRDSYQIVEIYVSVPKDTEIQDKDLRALPARTISFTISFGDKIQDPIPFKQARKPRSYASLKLRLTDWLTYLLTDEGKV